MRKTFLLVIGIIIIAGIGFGLWWYCKETQFVVELKELEREIKNVSQDVSDLKLIAKEDNLETLDQDLSALGGELPLEQELPATPTIRMEEIENFGNELLIELDGISNDLKDLEEFESDVLLGNFEDWLSEF